MSDKLVVEIDSKDAEVAMRNLDRLTTAAEQMGKAFENTKGATSALRELRLMLTGIKGQGSSLDELKNSIQSLNSTADSLKRSFAGSVGQLGRIFKNEMAELKSIVQETGLGVGRAAAKGIEDGMAEAPAAIRKQGRTIAAAAKAEATRIYEAMVAGQANAKIKDPSALFQLQKAGATLSPYHKQVLANWKEGQKQMLAALKKQLDEGEAETQKLLADQASRASQLSAGSAGVASSAAARQRAEGYTNAFGVYISKGVQEAEDAAFRRLSAGTGGVAAAAAARNRAEGYTDAFGNFIASGTQKAESAALKALSAGSGGVAAAAAGRARAEGYTNAFGMYVSKGMQLAEQSAQRALSAGSGGVAAAAAARNRAEGYTNAFGVYISKGVQDAEASALAKLSAGAGGTAAAAAGRARAEGYTNAFGVYISKGIQDQINKAEAAAARALSAGSGGVAAAAAARPRAVGPTNALGVIGSQIGGDLPKRTQEVDNLSKAFKKLTIDGNDAHSMARGLASGFNLLWLTWGNLVPLFTGASISFGLKKTFDIGSEVEYQIKMMETLGQTTQTQGRIIRQALRDIDQTTQFSLTELSQAMVRLGQSGKTPAEALQILRPAADLASVGMVDLKTSTDLLIQTQALFGKSTADVGKIAAQVFEITKSGVLNVEDIGDSMKYASEANTRFGKSVEETLTILGALAQAGIKGTAGGTAYINFLRDLNGRSTPAVNAMKALEQATGKTIAVFDKAGKQRSAIEIFTDIAAAADNLKAKDADKLLAKIFSDRGGRTFFAMVRDGTIDLTKMVDKLKDVDPNSLFMAAKGLMDTTKGALNILQGAMVGALDQVFEANETKFKTFITDITAVISSPEFAMAIHGMVGAVSGLYESIKTLMPVLTTLGTAWAVFKAASIGVSIFQGLAVAIAGMAPVLGMTIKSIAQTTGALVTSTAAWSANGVAMIGNVAASRAAAAGMDAVGVAAARTAATTAVAGAGMRGLSVVLGFLANPIVGIIATVGALGYAFLSTKSSAESGMSGAANAVTANGAIIESQLLKEISLARQRNSIVAGGAFASEEARVDQMVADNARRARQVQFLLDKSENRKFSEATRLESKKLAEREIQTMQDNERIINTARDQINAGKLDSIKRQEEQERKARADADRMTARAKAEADATALKSGGDFGGRRKFVEQIRVANDNELKEIEKRNAAELSMMQNQAANAQKILDARHQAGLISEGEYQAQAFAQIKQSEADQLALLNASKAEYMNGLVAQATVLGDALQKAMKLGDNTQIEKFTTDLQNLGQTAETFYTGVDNSIARITDNGMARLEVASIKAQAAIKKLADTEREYWKKDKDEINKLRSLDEMEAKYKNINESVFSLDAANKVATMTGVAETEKFNAKLAEMDYAYEVAEQAALAFMTANIMALASGDTEAQKLYKGLRDVADALKAAREAAGIKAEASIRDRSLIAFEKARQAQIDAFSNGLADAVETSIFEGGKAGGQKFIDVIRNELLRKPLVAVIRGVMSSVVGSIFGGAGGAGGGGGGGGIGGVLGLASNASSLYSAATGAGVLGGAATAAGYGASALFSGNALGALSGGMGMLTSGGGAAIAAQGAGMIAGVLGPVVLGIVAISSLLKRKLKDSGISGQFGGATGFEGQSYKFYKGGLLRSDKTEYSALDGSLRKMLGDTFATMQAQVISFADVLGLNSDKINTFTSDIKLSLHGLSEQDAQAKIQEALATVNDQLAQEVLGSWTEVTKEVVRTAWSNAAEMDSGANLQRQYTETVTDREYTPSEYAREGEKAIDTLTRLATSLTTVNSIWENLGYTVYESSLAGADAASKMADAFGGLENMAAVTDAYYENFYSDAEKAANATRDVTNALADVGLEMPKTREEFRALVEAQIALGEAGTPAAVALMQASGAFAALTPTIEDMVASVGINAEQISTTLRDGLLGRVSGEEMGTSIGTMITNGIQNAIAGGFADQITQVFMQGIVNPVIQAAMTGSSISAAVSQASIDAMVAQANNAASAIEAILNDPGFQAAMAQIQAAVGSLASASSVGYVAPVVSGGGGSDPGSSVEPVEQAWKDLLASIVESTQAAQTELSRLGMTSYERALAEIQDRAQAQLKELLGGGYRAAEQRALNSLKGIQYTYGIAQNTWQSLADIQTLPGVKALYQSKADQYAAHIEQLNSRIAELEELLGTLPPEIQALIDAETALLNARNELQAANIVGDLQTEIERLNFTPLEKELAGISDRAADYIKSLRDLGQGTDANIAAVQAWEEAMRAAAQSGGAAANISQKFEDAYKSQLGRAADTAGLEYWVGVVESGTLTLETAMQAFAEGATGEKLSNRILELTDAEGYLAKMRANELSLLSESNAALQARIWALEDEAKIAQERTGLQDTLNQLTMTSTELRALEIAKLDESNRPLQERIWLLEDEKRIAEERLGLESQLLQLQGNTAALRAIELAKLDESNRPLQEQIWALEDQKNAAQEAASALSTAESALRSAYEAEASKLKQTADTFGGFVKSLQSYIDQLTLNDAALSPEEKYLRNSAEFDRVALLAASGDEDAISKLQEIGSNLLDASRDYNASGAAYQSDLQRVLDQVKKAMNAAAIEENIAKSQLTALQAQVGALIDIKDAVKSVDEAIREYIAAKAGGTGTGGTGTGGTGTGGTGTGGTGTGGTGTGGTGTGGTGTGGTGTGSTGILSGTSLGGFTGETGTAYGNTHLDRLSRWRGEGEQLNNLVSLVEPAYPGDIAASATSDYGKLVGIVQAMTRETNYQLASLGSDKFREVIAQLYATGKEIASDSAAGNRWSYLRDLEEADAKARAFTDQRWLSSLLFGPQQALKLDYDSRYGDDLAVMIRDGDPRITEIKGIMGSQKLAATLSSYGKSYQEFLDGILSNSSSQVHREAAAAQKISHLPYLLDPAKRGFAKGGYVTPGFALVGEEGPELVDFSQPGRVYTAAQTREALAGGEANAEIVAELRATRAALQAILSKISQGDQENVEATRKVERRLAELENRQKLAAAAPVRV